MSISVHIIDQMKWAQDTFVFCMDKLNHDTEMSFGDKAAMVAQYKSFFPLWPHNNRLLQDTLDRINPAYAGRTKWIICGEAFWVIATVSRISALSHTVFSRALSTRSPATHPSSSLRAARPIPGRLGAKSPVAQTCESHPGCSSL